MAKGIGGLVAKPIKGTFDLVAQPIAGAINTPYFLYKKIVGSDTVKDVNFKIFGI